MLPAAAQDLIRSGPYAHVTTIDPQGMPHVTLAWVGLDGEHVVFGTLSDQKKLRNLRRDPRVVISIETDKTNDFGLLEYLVLYGRAEVTDGGAPELLQELAHTYLGPDVKFPPMPDPPPGYVVRIAVERVGGVGHWA